MAITELNNELLEVSDGLGSIVVMRDVADVPGGRSIDCSLLADDAKVVKAGHIIIVNTTTGEHAALGVSDNAYAALPSGYKYRGVLKASILTRDPRGAILTAGQINAAACPCPVTDAIVAALPAIDFANRY